MNKRLKIYLIIYISFKKIYKQNFKFTIPLIIIYYDSNIVIYII